MTNAVGEQLCPVCGGRGLVVWNFYSRMLDSADASPPDVECQSCAGFGHTGPLTARVRLLRERAEKAEAELPALIAE